MSTPEGVKKIKKSQYIDFQLFNFHHPRIGFVLLQNLLKNGFVLLQLYPKLGLFCYKICSKMGLFCYTPKKLHLGS
jgi:hypothetical protein